jgi:hypothetical protein
MLVLVVELIELPYFGQLKIDLERHERLESHSIYRLLKRDLENKD